MKRGTFDHPKLIALARELHIPRCYAGGLLEATWHFTARFCARGDLGRYSDADICAGIHLPTKNPERIVAAMVKTGWLDKHPTHRLLVHDWHEHTDDSVKKTMKNRRCTFYTFLEMDGNLLETDGKKSPALALPKPEPKPEPSAEARAPSLAEQDSSNNPQTTGPPTVEQVKEQAMLIGYPELDAEAFIAHYAAQGWNRGNGQPIKNWRAEITVWRKRRSEFENKKHSRDSPPTPEQEAAGKEQAFAKRADNAGMTVEEYREHLEKMRIEYEAKAKKSKGQKHDHENHKEASERNGPDAGVI